MHYLLTVIGDTDNPADDSAPGAIDAFNDRLKDEGRWVFAGGLTDPQDATVTDSRGGEPVFTDGPFVESKEFLAGFWVIDRRRPRRRARAVRGRLPRLPPQGRDPPVRRRGLTR